MFQEAGSDIINRRRGKAVKEKAKLRWRVFHPRLPSAASSHLPIIPQTALVRLISGRNSTKYENLICFFLFCERRYSNQQYGFKSSLLAVGLLVREDGMFVCICGSRLLNAGVWRLTTASAANRSQRLFPP